MFFRSFLFCLAVAQFDSSKFIQSMHELKLGNTDGPCNLETLITPVLKPIILLFQSANKDKEKRQQWWDCSVCSFCALRWSNQGHLNICSGKVIKFTVPRKLKPPRPPASLSSLNLNEHLLTDVWVNMQTLHLFEGHKEGADPSWLKAGSTRGVTSSSIPCECVVVQYLVRGHLGSALKGLWQLPHYQSTFLVLSLLGFKPRTLHFSDQSPADQPFLIFSGDARLNIDQTKQPNKYTYKK